MAHTRRTRCHEQFTDAGFFVLRTPLLPFDELVAWSADLQAARVIQAQGDATACLSAWQDDVQLLRERLRTLITRPEIVHALFVASPSLQIGLDRWLRDPDGRKGLQAEHALVRYFARMAGRATPFGLFSGCSVGEVTDDGSDGLPKLLLQGRATYRPASRLDFDYLFALTHGLQADARVARHLRYEPNSSLHRIGASWHYVEARLGPRGRTHHLVTVEDDVFLDAALLRSRTAATVSEIVDAVLACPGAEDIAIEEAEEYVRSLIGSDLLVCTLSPCVTGDPVADLIGQLDALPPLADAAETLRHVRQRMAGLDAQGVGAPPATYAAITSELAHLPATIEPSRLFQVDMVKPVERATLPPVVIDEILHGVSALCVLSNSEEVETLRTFRDAFIARYDRAAVPLLEALDEETGIGFGSIASSTAPLLRGLWLGRNTPSDGARRGGLDPMQTALLRALVDHARRGGEELRLDDLDWTKTAPTTSTLPDSFVVSATLAAESMAAVAAGHFEVRLREAVGPSGARLFGRFCHTDPVLEAHVRRYVSREETHDAGAVYAEIVHLPEGRIGNVLCRPILREYELVYLGRPSVPRERQVLASELLVSVEQGEIVLRSTRLGRRIIPRLSNAHGFVNQRLSSVYRFLCYLQHQHGVAVPGFGWGPLDTLEQLPRLRFGRVILATARWRLSSAEMARITTGTSHERFIAMQHLRHTRVLPRWILFEESDRALPIDLDNPLSVDAFVQVLKRVEQAVVREIYPSPDRLCVTGPEGRFVHELHVPFIKRLPEADIAARAPSAGAKDVVRREVRARPPGSEWLYVKLYGGPAALDEALGAVAAFVGGAATSGALARWFFIRYGDPEPHLRIRFNGHPDRLRHDLTAIVAHAFNPLLASGRLWRIQFDTYERELERYGGLEGTRLAEEMFCADSQAVLEVLRDLDVDSSTERRWWACLLGIDAMATDFQPDLGDRRTLMASLRDGTRRALGTAADVKHQLGSTYRRERAGIEALFDPASPVAATMAPARAAFARRSHRVAPVIRELRTLEQRGELSASPAELVGSFLHMHVNRLMRWDGREHELVLYDLLFRVYDSRAARTTKHAAAVTGTHP
jgi:thiopeptide-type bacteriocin biosynthesis protein